MIFRWTTLCGSRSLRGMRRLLIFERRSEAPRPATSRGVKRRFRGVSVPGRHDQRQLASALDHLDGSPPCSDTRPRGHPRSVAIRDQGRHRRVAVGETVIGVRSFVATCHVSAGPANPRASTRLRAPPASRTPERTSRESGSSVGPMTGPETPARRRSFRSDDRKEALRLSPRRRERARG